MMTCVLSILLLLFQSPPPLSKPPGHDVKVERHSIGALRLVHQMGPDLFTGGAPRNEADFDSLREVGIRTLISVDGALPDIEVARVRGLRYVHLPIGYDGINATVAARLARAIRDLPGPIYLHCHHGRHRAPAAAAVGLAGLGRVGPEGGVQMLQFVGTSPDYPGLYLAVKQSRRLASELIDAVPIGELPEIAVVSDLATGMAEVDRIYDRLALLAANDWVVPKNHADLVPAAEAGILTERFRGMSELAHPFSASGPREPPLEFRPMIKMATALESAIRDRRTSDADAIFTSITSECRACHRRDRDQNRLAPTN
jgi:protein tyrosine phosphatase (PTP) superfamily phosphohydrolase (DUF442 family)